MEAATKELLNYGVLGAFAIILISVIVVLARYIRNLHIASTAQHQKSADEFAKMANESHTAIRGNTDVLSGLKTLLETTRERR